MTDLLHLTSKQQEHVHYLIKCFFDNPRVSSWSWKPLENSDEECRTHPLGAKPQVPCPQDIGDAFLTFLASKYRAPGAPLRLIEVQSTFVDKWCHSAKPAAKPWKFFIYFHTIQHLLCTDEWSKWSADYFMQLLLPMLNHCFILYSCALTK